MRFLFTIAVFLLAAAPASAAVYPSDQLVQNVGVVVHTDYGNATGDAEQNYDVYPNGASQGTPPERTYKPLLCGLGVRWIRAGLKPWRDRKAFGIFQTNDLYSSCGIRTLAGVGDPPDYAGNLRNLEAGTYDRAAIMGLELANEPAVTDALQGEIFGVYGWMDRHPEWKLPIVAPSLVNTGQWPKLEVDGFVDEGNVHPYAGGLPPEGALDGRMVQAQAAVPGKPVDLTETGYWTGDTAGGSDFHLPPQPGVPEGVAAAYAVRDVAAVFERDSRSKMAFYELIDQWPENRDGESRFGLLRNDFTPKPAYTTLERLMSYLSDPGDDYTPRRYELKVTGPSNLHTVQLRKRNGTIELLLWTDDSLWNRDASLPLDPGSTTVSVSVDTPEWRYGVYGWLRLPTTGSRKTLPVPSRTAGTSTRNEWVNFPNVTIPRGQLAAIEIRP
jgi:hypothetical protein